MPFVQCPLTEIGFSPGCGAANVAVTAVLLKSVRTHAPVDPPPLQPPNVFGGVGLAASVPCVPEVHAAEHVEPQLMPPSFEMTVPAPVPALEIAEVRLPLATECL